MGYMIEDGEWVECPDVEEGVCIWTYYDGEDHYLTKCGSVLEINIDDVADMNFCCYCGNPLTVGDDA